MFVFLDESFRSNLGSGNRFGALCGIAVSDESVKSLQAGVYAVRKPYHEHVLKQEQELHGKKLLGSATFKCIEKIGYSYQFNLVEDLLGFARKSGFAVFGVICFDPMFHTFACADEHSLDKTFKCLFSRIDGYAKRKHPGQLVKLVFDDRHVQTNRENAKAITNFLVKSPVGRKYDSILPYPLFAVSQGHNYGLQLADIVTTVVAKKFQGDERIRPLWDIVKDMIYRFSDGDRRWTSLKKLDDPDKKKTTFGDR